MRLPVNWLRDYADLDPAITPTELSDALIRVGLEVERVESGADGLSGPIVIGRVLSAEPEPQKNGKTIRWCSVDTGDAEPHGIVCGAPNVEAGGLVVVALPGAVLPGGFAIAARKTYGHISDGMICSVRELGIGDDHDGILVLSETALPADSAEPGADALDALGLRDAVLDIAVTPDRGYCFSMRGLAREASIALTVGFHDVAEGVTIPPVDGGAYDVTVGDPAGCDQFAARAVTGVDPTRPTPDWMAQRLRQSGMRPISLIVDVTNYVMLETGQPLHAFDRSKLTGPIDVRRALVGETLTTLDDVKRTLHPDDLVVADDTGAIALAGVMGGASTEIDDTTSEVLLEAAHWDPASILRAVRRHKLPSEAGKRFERGVDPRIAGVALARCVELLIDHGGAGAAPGYTVVGVVASPRPIRLPAGLPARLAGMPIAAEAAVHRLEQVGCTVSADTVSADTDSADTDSADTDSADAGIGSDGSERVLVVTPPTWRSDITDPADLVEEVVRLEGYDRIPSTLPSAPPGRGLTEAQKLRRAVSRAAAAAGYTEVLTTPFVPSSVHDVLGWPADDPRHRPMVVVNPLSDAEPELRTSLLPGLLATVVRNTGRGLRDVAVFEIGRVFTDRDGRPTAPTLGVEHRPTDDQIAVQNAALPDQPRHLAAVAAGSGQRAGWWGDAQPVDWADAIELARAVGRQFRVELHAVAAQTAPWHPGRCAALVLDGRVIGHAGELHPRVISSLDLPERTVAVELDLDAFEVPPPARTPSVSGFPPVLLDLALVVGSDVPAAEVLAAVRDGAGELLESVRIFDVYRDVERLGADSLSLAFALRFRAPDRTMTIEEATAARDRAVGEAAQRTGARLRT